MKAYLLAELGQYYMKKGSFEKALQVPRAFSTGMSCHRANVS
jgi:hypothetical protein